MEPLPIAAFQNRIIQSVQLNQVTIITAETGAGKSTQVPQYLIEAGFSKVVVTQPRILAARNLSIRVREEWGQRVGYRTANERDDTQDTEILYCTDGLQLVREVTGEGITQGQVLVLDEIHEFNQNMEVLIAWARKRCVEDAQFKLIIMSATIDSAALARYFKTDSIIEVPGRNHQIEIGQGEDVVQEIISIISAVPKNVLVFLPGKAEIEQVASRIADLCAGRDIAVIPLHSQLEAEQQQLAFNEYPYGKVILATNIAQTSITIDDIDVVIDSGLERRNEIESGVEGLIIAQASRADCLQRAGRAGRTKPGRYILAPLDRLPCDPLERRIAYAVPEMLRTYLDRVVLRLASMHIDIEELDFFHNPPREAVLLAKQTLRNLGALTDTNEVTEMGRKMERFPVQSRFARMLVQAEGLPDSTRLKLALVMSIQEVGGIVKNGVRSNGWLQFTIESESDVLAQYDVYLEIQTIALEEYEDLGVVAKSVAKMEEIFTRLQQELAVPLSELRQLTQTERTDLMRCIVSGQTDLLWLCREDGSFNRVGGRDVRERSRNSVVKYPGLVAGIPFNLEVVTSSGVKTLQLVQDLTVVDPEWLVGLAPKIFKTRKVKNFFDPYWGCLVEQWSVLYRGKPIKDVRRALTIQNPQNRKLFMHHCAQYVVNQLTVQANRQKSRVPPPSIEKLIIRIQRIVGKEIEIARLSTHSRLELQALATLTSERSHQSIESTRKKTRRRGH